jgi:hypothetical protein
MKKAENRPLQTITTNLFRADVEALKSEAGRAGIPWQLRLRLLVAAALSRSRPKTWKFLIPADRWYRVPNASASGFYEVKGCVALVTAKTKEDARLKLIEYAQSKGVRFDWIDVPECIVVEVNAEKEGVIVWST